MLAYARTCICTTKGKIPPGPLLGKQNIQAKEDYCVPDVKPVNFIIAFTSLVECLEIPSPLSFEHGISVNFQELGTTTFKLGIPRNFKSYIHKGMVLPFKWNLFRSNFHMVLFIWVHVCLVSSNFIYWVCRWTLWYETFWQNFCLNSWVTARVEFIDGTYI